MLVHDFHQLSRWKGQLVDLAKGSVMVHNGLESSLALEVKATQDSNPIFLNLKEAVQIRRQKFFPTEMLFFILRDNYVV